LEGNVLQWCSVKYLKERYVFDGKWHRSLYSIFTSKYSWTSSWECHHSFRTQQSGSSLIEVSNNHFTFCHLALHELKLIT
jgi:hypothetical protein